MNEFEQLSRDGVYDGLVLSETQLRDIRQRLDELGNNSDAFVRQLEYEDLKLRLLAFIVASEQKLQQWTVKYGRQPDVETILNAYGV